MVRLCLSVALLAGGTVAGATATAPAALAGHEVPGTRVLSGYVTVGSASDQAELRMQVALPLPERPVPTLLYYQGYSGFLGGVDQPFREWARDNGYAVMAVGLRGTGCSSGGWDFMSEREALDARDVIKWIAEQPWPNDRVAMVGASFAGFEQLRVASLDDLEELVAISPGSPMADLYRDFGYLGGIPNTGGPAGLTTLIQSDYRLRNQGVGPNSLPETPPGDNAQRCLTHQPRQAEPTGWPVTLFGMHRFDDDEMRTRSPSSYSIPIPTHAMVTWQDDQVGSRAIDALSRMVTGPLHAVLSNGGHFHWFSDRYQKELRAFLDFYVKGVDNGYDATDRVQVWWETTGSPCPGLVRPQTCPRDEQPAWVSGLPSYLAPSARSTELFLTEGAALTSSPGAGAPDSYTYVGGTGQRRGNEGFPFVDPTVGLDPAAPAGAQAAGTDWSDPAPPGMSLTYTSPPLTKDLAALGSASLDLWLESTAPDTDVQAVLTEVRPDGQEVYVQAGWLRASRRAEDPARSTPTRPFHSHSLASQKALTPLTPNLMRVEVWPFGHVFRKGSSVRVWIEAPARQFGARTLESVPGVAVNRVHHSDAYPSVLRLSTLPGHAAPVGHPRCGTVLHQPCRPDPVAARK